MARLLCVHGDPQGCARGEGLAGRRVSNYIAFDLDALKRVSLVAAAGRVRAESVTHGLANLWQWCWSEKVDRVDLVQLSGFFPGRPKRVGAALSAFRFLEPTDAEGVWRVRGADRWLRIRAARSKGGKAAAGNLKRGKSLPSATPPVSPGSLPAPAGPQPEPSRAEAGADSPAPSGSYTQHPTPNTLETKEEGAAGAVAPPRRVSNWAGFVPTAPPAAARQEAPSGAPQPEATQLKPPEGSAEKPKTVPARRVDRDNPHDAHWLRMLDVRHAEGYQPESPPPRHEVAKYCNGVMLALQGDEERALESYAAWLREPGVRQRCGPWRLWLSQWPQKLLPTAPRRAPAHMAPCARCGEASCGQTWGAEVCAGCSAEWNASDAEGEAAFRAWLGRPALRAVGGGA